MALVAGQIAKQAEMGAILDVFQVTTWSFLLMLPLVLLLRRSR
jgi:DHA2 family multidrug resistance protein